MALLSASSDGTDIAGTLDRIDQPDVRLVLYFYSPDMKAHSPHQLVQARFPAATCLGASMIGGWSSDGPIEKGFTACSVSSTEIGSIYSSMSSGVKEGPQETARKLVNDVSRKLNGTRVTPNEYVGIVLVDGLSLGEMVMKELTVSQGFALPLIGGAAADELAFEETTVDHNGVSSGDGAVLCILKMNVPFFYNHYVHYVPTNREFLITKADPEKRIVWEIDNVPAAQYYAKLLGLSGADEIEHIHFSQNPLGVVIGDTVYTRSPNHVVDGAGLQFYCFIEAGTRMRLLEQGDIVSNARGAMKEAREYLGTVNGAVLFNCVLRYLEMKEDGKLEAFHEVFSQIPYVGFNTYGEELFTHHNQTLTALFLGE